jgi:hypothetical protein
MDASSSVQVYVYSSDTSLAFYLKDVVFPAIVGGLGTNSPVVSVSNQIAGATNVVMQVSVTPERFLRDARLIVITLAGAGLSCSGGCLVSFASPTNFGLTASAAISGTQVLTVTLSSAYTFPGMERILFDVSNVSNPSASQAEMRSVRAVVLNSANQVIGASSDGIMCPIFKGSLQNSSALLSRSVVGANTYGISTQWDYSIFSVISVLNDPAPVFFSIWFSALTSGLVRSISITGLAFTKFFSDSVSNCSHLNVVVPASVYFSESSRSIAMVLAEGLNTTSSSLISCFVGFFVNSQTRKNGNILSISTFSALNQPLDISPKIPYSDIFQGQLSNVSFSLSNVSVMEKVALSFSFCPSSFQYPIKSVSVIGIEFSQFAPQSVDCYMHFDKLIASAAYSISSQSLVIVLSQSIQVNAYVSFSCQVTGFSNPTRALKLRDAFIATYDSDSLPVDIGQSVLPAIFPAKAQFLNVSFSSYIESAISTLTFRFALLQGLSSSVFSLFNLTSNMLAGVSEGTASCNNLNFTGMSVFPFADRVTISFNGLTVTSNQSLNIECQISRVINAPYKGLNQGFISLEAYDSSRLPLLYVSQASFGVTCKPGQFAANGACRQCLAGTYCNSNCSVLSPCLVCPAGSYSISASSSCFACPAGSYAASAGKSSCDLCPAGSTSATGSVMCRFAGAFYTAASWNSSSPNTLFDMSPYQQHVVNISGGLLTRVTPADETPYLSGSSNIKIKFPSFMISGNFTLIYKARFEGSMRRSIFHACMNPSWASAFHQGKAGVSARPSCGIITEIDDLHGSDWVVVTERMDSVRTNGVQRSKSNVGGCQPLQDTLCINFFELHSSDFAIETFMWFNDTLGIDEIMVLEALLMTQRKFWTPNRMQVKTKIMQKCLKSFITCTWLLSIFFSLRDCFIAYVS